MTTETAACRICGVATDRRLAPRQVWGTDGRLRDDPAGGHRSGLCDDCDALRPGTAEMPDPGIAFRAAARVIGVPEGDPHFEAALREDDSALDRLIYGEGREPQRKPWKHVSKEKRDRLKAARVRALDHRVHAAADHDRPVPPHAPPPLREGFAVENKRVVPTGEVEYGPPGCLACGVGKSAQWHGPTATTAYTSGPGVVEGFLCDVCEPHLTAAGAHGRTFLQRAVTAHFGREWSEGGPQAPRLRAWVALHRDEGCPPQAEPWSWVEGLAWPKFEPKTLNEALAALAELTARVEALEAGR